MSKQLIEKLIDFVRLDPDRSKKFEYKMEHPDRGGYSEVKSIKYTGTHENGATATITHNVITHVRRKKYTPSSLMFRYLNPKAEISTSFMTDFGKGGASIARGRRGGDEKINTQFALSILKHVKKTIPQIAKEHGATHWSVEARDETEGGSEESNKLNLYKKVLETVAGRKPKKVGARSLRVRL